MCAIWYRIFTQIVFVAVQINVPLENRHWQSVTRVTYDSTQELLLLLFSIRMLRRSLYFHASPRPPAGVSARNVFAFRVSDNLHNWEKNEVDERRIIVFDAINQLENITFDRIKICTYQLFHIGGNRRAIITHGSSVRLLLWIANAAFASAIYQSKTLCVLCCVSKYTFDHKQDRILTW